MNELEALVILSSIPHVGSMKIRLLLQHFGSGVNALNAKSSELQNLPGFGPKILSQWENWKQDLSWHHQLKLVEKNQVNLIPFTSSQYPKRLLEIPDYPILLYVKGEILPSDQRCIAIVGTRNASIYGKSLAEKIAYNLAEQGFTIVSGLARGVDTAAHQGALQSGRTFAIIGSGLAKIYPTENLLLSQKIAAQGALMSEFPMLTPPDRQNFPQRNRIVSGMTLGTLLIEAPLESGAMITMEKAFSQGRKLFALPGRVDQENFRGNHFLIKSGRAQLVESAEEIVNHFNDLIGWTTRKPLPVREFFSLEKEEESLLSQLPDKELTFDEIVELTQLPVTKIHVLLMSLLLKQVIKEFPGKLYKKTLSNRCPI